ncbi:LamG-like jellyroll fold domain-containing protein [Winogradskyella aurantia]|uniref:LamG-like jellyroll fold domain-containing protein n=1 Tax=Winogradskyella aurantia TaxID=1915063 RepID=A0A265UWT4_9FLAO|nr:LamG-like jellyroll fold domain-containing protein [Winogradskyella aurantia]OZV69682.1 hypothetical protein CA834_03395 [Winogradskyella aurantia]
MKCLTLHLKGLVFMCIILSVAAITAQTSADRSVYFDGTEGFIDMGDHLDLNSVGFTLSVWVKTEASGSGITSILSKRDVAFQRGYDLRLLADNRIQIIWKNGSSEVLISRSKLPDNEWHHIAVVYNGTLVSIYVDGILDTSDTKTPPIPTTESFIIGAAGTDAPFQHFKGHLDEVRLWRKALSYKQLRFMMNQEIINSNGQVRGTELPMPLSKNDIESLLWSDLVGYFPMSVDSNNNLEDVSGNGNLGTIYLATLDDQSAPLPYKTFQDGDWDSPNTWVNGTMQYIPGAVSIVDANKTIDWTIVRTSHAVNMDNASLPSSTLGNRTILALYVDANELRVNGDNDAGTGNGLTVSHYLRLTGKLNLEGESQLVQELHSDLDVESSGQLEKDQQGTADTFTYNYWSSPVGAIDIDKNNYSYSVRDVMYDGANPVNFSSTGYNGAATDPIRIADYWIWKYANQPNNSYSSWQHVRRTGTIFAGEGFTMKGPGTGPIFSKQNYVFRGKPNNGPISLNIHAQNDYLIGNPYPSAIDANQFILDNIGPSNDASGQNPLIDGTLYFWKHWGGGSHVLADYEGGYATYNFSGAVAEASYGTNDPNIATGGRPTQRPGRYIPVGQGFFVVGKSTGEINFNNGQRVFVTEGNSSSVFMRNDFANSTQAFLDDYEGDDRMKFRIGFNSVNTIHRQLLLTIDENATPNIDLAYDAKMKDVQMDDMFWLINDETYVIQASNEVNEDSIYDLGVRTDTDGINTIGIDALENIDDDLDIYLYDAELDIYHDLRAESYSIFLNAGEYLNRFKITFSNADSSLGLEDNRVNHVDILFSNDIEQLVLVNPKGIDIESIELFNIMGQSILTIDSIITSSYNTYSVGDLSMGAYIIKLKTPNREITKKIIIN